MKKKKCLYTVGGNVKCFLKKQKVESYFRVSKECKIGAGAVVHAVRRLALLALA